MNCKPGDLALIQGPTNRFAGWLVEVLYRAPMVDHDLPDGTPSEAATTPECWVIRSLGSPFGGDNGGGKRLWNLTPYAQCRDCFLRPIQPDGDADEIPCAVGKPEKVTA